MSVRCPSEAAETAAVRPAGPAPRMNRSYSSRPGRVGEAGAGRRLGPPPVRGLIVARARRIEPPRHRLRVVLGSLQPAPVGEQGDRLPSVPQVTIREKLRQGIEVEVDPAERDLIALKEVPRGLGGRLADGRTGSP